MAKLFNRLLDKLSEFLAARKGLLPLFGIVLVVFNWIFQLLIPDLWIAETNLLLHVGVILAVIGFLLAWAL